MYTYKSRKTEIIVTLTGMVLGFGGLLYLVIAQLSK